MITDGKKRLARYLQLINQAQSSISITTFIFANDPVGVILIEALTQKAAAGVKVRILVDYLGALLLRYPALTAYKKSGGKIAFFMPLLQGPFRGRLNLRNHRKLMIFDQQVALLGGVNLAQEYLGSLPDKRSWVDLSVQVSGPCVQDLAIIFEQDWSFAMQVPLQRLSVTKSSPVFQTGSSAQIVASGPDIIGDPLYDILLSSIFSAREEILIATPYFIPDESLTKALELAAKRNVIVKVLLPATSNHRLADLARGSFIRQLQEVGVQFHFFKTMIHAKAVLIDENTAILGSANFDMRSLLLNYEVGILLFDKATVEPICGWFNTCLIDTETRYSDETFFRQLVEGVGRVIGPFFEAPAGIRASLSYLSCEDDFSSGPESFLSN